MKKVLSLILAAVMLTVMLVGCGGAKSGIDAIKASGKLTVYTEAGFAPYEFVYENEIVGVDIEIMKKVADKLGVELVVEDVNFDSITGAVKSGKADAGAAGMTITAENYKRPEKTDDPRLERFFGWKKAIGCIRHEDFGPDVFTPELVNRVSAFFDQLTPLYDYFNKFKV